MFKKRAEARSASRRHRQIMSAARHMADSPSLWGDETIQMDPEHVIVLAYGRHQIRVTPEEARDALGAALLERGFGLDRMTAA